VLLWLLFLALAGGLLGAAGLAGLFLYYGNDSSMPRVGNVRDLKPKTVTRIFDRNGIAVGEIFAERRTVVPFSSFPKLLVQAVVSSEDADFFEHRGLDYPGMLRAFFANLRAGKFVQGGSTITQQVVKTFFLTPERTIKRKIQEVILARRLENQLSKEEILYLYLNQIYLGHGCYGMQEASRFFFGKDVEQLTLAEIALLAGLPQSPERLSPLKHPDRAKRRQIYVLGEMARRGRISQDVARKVGENSIQVVRRKRPYFNQAPEFTDQVRAELAQTFGEDKLATLGLPIHTTLDAKLQLAARDAVRWGLRSLDARQGYRRPVARLSGNKLQRWQVRLKRTQKRFKTGHRYLALVKKVDDGARELSVDLGRRQDKVLLDHDSRYNPQDDAPSKRFEPGDLIRVQKAADHFRFAGGPQAALVAMQPATGDVLALVGGYRFRPGDFDRALRARRQPGSAFKPFVYGAALASRKFTPATIVDDAPVVLGGWTPRNFDGTYRGPMRLRQALAFSINSVAARVMDAVGVDPVRELAASMGIASPLGKDLSLALGTSEVLPIELATAYCAIANGGQRVQPRYITRIGKQAVEPPQTPRVLSPEVAFVLTSMMQSVVREGTARRARRLRRPVAGKTGTTNGHRDAWFAGFSPQLVAVVWVGFDSPRGLGRGETGGRAALPIWVHFMRQALRGKPKLPFSQPPGVVVQRIDPESGLLAAPGGEAIEEVFIQGTEPTETATTPDQVDPGTILMDPGIP
jgi:penicillin-binding protein 1A